MNCPNGHGMLSIKRIRKKMSFRGVDITVPVESYSCAVCGLKAGTVEQTAKIQRAISDSYRRAIGLLTGSEIVENRKNLGLSQDDLAKRMNVGIASIKRWETGTIQSKSMDHALRMAFKGERTGDDCTGNRVLSLPRIKLVLKEFESALGRKVLKINDRMLYAAKYLWYADMIAYRETGQSMTGATYAALPKGPQLNNYKDLVREITRANESIAASLSNEEKRIIARIARRFPKGIMIYRTSHQEQIVQTKPIGAIIPYSDSSQLTGI